MRRATLPLDRPHKYRAKRTTVDGITFASKKEATRYQELRLWEKSGGIRNLRLQPRFVLSVDNALYPENDQGRMIELGSYVGDFAYEECDHANGHRGWKDVVEDVKGFRTPLYCWKKKHVEAQFGITIREI